MGLSPRTGTLVSTQKIFRGVAHAQQPQQTSLFEQQPAVDLSSLNPAQREAAECTSGPLLVLAGAGSGKTRVLTYRIAHMVADEGVRPWRVLAITFTNKAAGEMRERLAKIVPGGICGMWVCTFHAMDFDDLLLKAYELLSTQPQVLERYQERFVQISVDEYQDTNKIQYLITRLLASKYQNLMVVGDDDQSIYSWRGADITNILNFEKDYPTARVVKLEQNYRSTGHILAAANAVVAHNSRRKDKRLFTDAGDGHKVKVCQADDERDEGRWIGSQIEKLPDGGASYNDMAVFYRTNAQSRVLEDMLLRAGVPCKIAGGTRFFDRAEIRDAHDRALGQGPGVSRGVCRGHGGEPVPACWPQGGRLHGGGAPPGVRGHHPCRARALQRPLPVPVAAVDPALGPLAEAGAAGQVGLRRHERVERGGQDGGPELPRVAALGHQLEQRPAQLRVSLYYTL